MTGPPLDIGDTQPYRPLPHREAVIGGEGI
jgi:hypothetical protein